MITVAQYFGAKIDNPEATEDMVNNATGMLEKVNAFLAHAEEEGVYAWPACPNTGTNISGSRGGAGDGGFRLSGSATGAATSQHKKARAVDVYDAGEALDAWLSTFETGGGHNSKLAEFGLYREAPHATIGWCHLQDIAPHSGHSTFEP